MIVNGNNFISHHLKHNKVFAAGKIGGTELKLLHTYLNHLSISQDLKEEAENVSGLVPTTQKTLEWFSKVFIESLSELDLLCSWSKIIPQLEHTLINEYAKAYSTPLRHLEPYYFDDPWTKFLEDKKVLVFSPFADSITANFKHLSKVWSNKITSNFILETIKYPSSITITDNSKYTNYKDIFDQHIDIIHQKDFDLGIFGTGYTGLLFAAECKKVNKSGLHLGGATQILFGVKGDRWSNSDALIPFFNEYWTAPTKEERPKGFMSVEGGCYW